MGRVPSPSVAFTLPAALPIFAYHDPNTALTIAMSTLLQSLDNPDVTFLIGQNGSGKSRKLRELAKHEIRRGRNVIVVSNTVFDRFPVKRAGNYARLSPAGGRSYVDHAFKTALTNQESDPRQTLRQIEKVLDYAGYDPDIRVEIRLRPDNSRTGFENLTALTDKIDERTTKLMHHTLVQGGAFKTGGTEIRLNQNEFSTSTEGLLAIIRNERILRHLHILKSISIILQKQDLTYPLQDGSSGELTLLASAAFIATHMRRDSVIFIDEPENSLHPKWQSEYCGRLLDQFHLYRPKLVIATHAPIVVSGALSDEVGSEVFVMPMERKEKIDAISIDGLLMEVFGVLPPASHYLSEKVSELLNRLQQHTVTLDQANAELGRLADISYDKRQKAFLTEAQKLAAEIANYQQDGAETE